MGVVEVALIALCVGLIIILINNIDEEEVETRKKIKDKK